MFSHLSHHLCTGILVPLLPLLKHDFELDYFRAGLLTSCFALAYGFSQLPIAVLSERIGQKTVVILGLLGLSLASVGAGVAGDYERLLVCLVLMGLFGSSYHAPSSAFLSAAFSKGRRGQMLGLHVTGGSLSFMITPFLAVLIATMSGTWRYAFILLALPALGAGVLLWGTVPGRGRAEMKRVVGFSEGKLSLRGALDAIGLLLGVTILLELITFSIYSFLPLFLTDIHGVSFQQAGIMTGVMIGVGVLGSPLGGALSDRVGRKRVILGSVISAGPLLCLLSVAPVGLWMLCVLVVYGLTMSFRMPATESLIADFVPAPRMALALAAYYFFSQESSSVITPLVGRLIDVYGMDPVFKGLALMACVVSVLALGRRS